ncbi:5458_t:CDS:2, partial [Ambispora leptoticha]
GATCCENGGSCPSGSTCCSKDCAPAGATCCENGGSCPSDHICCAKGCAPAVICLFVNFINMILVNKNVFALRGLRAVKTGYKCCEDGSTAPEGATCCGDGAYCPSSTPVCCGDDRCASLNNVDSNNKCCPSVIRIIYYELLMATRERTIMKILLGGKSFIELDFLSLLSY